MGNRAVITAAPYGAGNLGIYLHWNGGRASVEGFLQAAKDLGINFSVNPCGMARFGQMVGNWFGGNLSLGVDICRRLDCDNWDNGVYIVDPVTLAIVDRLFVRGQEEVDPEKTAAIRADVVEKNRQFFLPETVERRAA